jgi:hypothetical protein
MKIIFARKENIKIKGAAKPSIDKYPNSTIKSLTNNELHNITEGAINLVCEFIIWFNGLGMQFSIYSRKRIFFLYQPILSLIPYLKPEHKNNFSEKFEKRRNKKENKHFKLKDSLP